MPQSFAPDGGAGRSGLANEQVSFMDGCPRRSGRGCLARRSRWVSTVATFGSSEKWARRYAPSME